MAADKATLKASIKQAFLDELSSPTSDQTAAVDRVADAWANAIDTYLKAGVINVPAGIAFSASGPGGTITGVTSAGATGSIT